MITKLLLSKIKKDFRYLKEINTLKHKKIGIKQKEKNYRLKGKEHLK